LYALHLPEATTAAIEGTVMYYIVDILILHNYVYNAHFVFIPCSKRYFFITQCRAVKQSDCVLTQNLTGQA